MAITNRCIRTCIVTAAMLLGCEGVLEVGNVDSGGSGRCGNDRIDPGETCDPPESCPSCVDGDPCTLDTIHSGSAETCDLVCVSTPITACESADGCCPTSCNSGVDSDCSSRCGNGVVDPAETCDPPETCAESCTDRNACTVDTLAGSAANCNVRCVLTPVTACNSGDGCCPDGCSSAADSDCSSSCGNGEIDENETCDPVSTCPTQCDDMNACTVDRLTGNVEACSAACSHMPIAECANGDGCCPAGCVQQDDDDCAPQAPPAPTGLLAVPAKGAIGLEWEPVTNTLSYTIYWSTSPGVSPENGNAIASSATTHIHDGRDDGTTYYYIVTASGDGGESLPSAEVRATPGGEFELHRLGHGRVPSIQTADSVAVPLPDRIHVVIAAEGYLANEQATFDSDADAWFSEVFTVEPFATFTEAFVIWRWPAVSNEHLAAGTPQSADTAFRVPLSTDGESVNRTVPSTGETSMRVWNALSNFAYPATRFYPSGGRTSRYAMNLLFAFLLFEPAQGGSGFSGRMRGLENPANSAQRIAAAFAHNRVHEFSHALGRLQDEYLDEGQSDLGEPNALTTQSAYLSNVVSENDCDSLPWAHLLVGTTINPTQDNLVGAFGTPNHGYHPELKCLMNGTHDNANYFGGNGRLRVGHFCNFCRETMAFRILERTGVLPDPATSLDTWTSDYRTPFYDRFGLEVPSPVPQQTSDGTEHFQACVP